MFGTVRFAVLSAAMAEMNWKPGDRHSMTEHLGSILRETAPAVRHEPLPERWIELIKRLNAEEDASSPNQEKHRQ